MISVIVRLLRGDVDCSDHLDGCSEDAEGVGGHDDALRIQLTHWKRMCERRDYQLSINQTLMGDLAANNMYWRRKYERLLDARGSPPSGAGSRPDGQHQHITSGLISVGGVGNSPHVSIDSMSLSQCRLMLNVVDNS